jgi:hypothetical protein
MPAPSVAPSLPESGENVHATEDGASPVMEAVSGGYGWIRSQDALWPIPR